MITLLGFINFKKLRRQDAAYRPFHRDREREHQRQEQESKLNPKSLGI